MAKTVVAVAIHIAVVTAVAEFPALVGLSPSEDFRRALEVGAAASVENINECVVLRVFNPKVSPPSPALSLYPFMLSIRPVFSAPSRKLFLHW